jgi:xanthine dehydrogenase accessory factor
LIYDEMVADGFTREELSQVHCPIGTAIGAETPEELAVSIVGELIKVRAEKNAPKKDGSPMPCCKIKAV